jgi:hypothetical protein
VYHQALKLGIAILHGGNEEVQRYMLQCFINGQEEGFFPEIRSRIRRSIIEIKGMARNTTPPMRHTHDATRNA